MKNLLSPRDWQALSAYLDHQLAAQERQKLEQRLQTEQELRNGYQELQRMQLLLRSQPPLRAPHNFTLSAQALGKPSPSRGFPVLRFAAALASLLFVVLLVGDLLGATRPVATSEPMALMQAEMAQPVEDVPSMKTAPQPSEATSLPEEPPMMFALPAGEAEQNVQEDQRQVEDESAAALEAQELPAQVAQQPVIEEQLAVERTLVFGIDRRVVRGLEVFLALVAIIAALSAFYLQRRV